MAAPLLGASGKDTLALMPAGVPPQQPQLHQGVCHWGGSPRLLAIGPFVVLMQGANQGEQVLAWLRTPEQLELSPKLVLAT